MLTTRRRSRQERFNRQRLGLCALLFAVFTTAMGANRNALSQDTERGATSYVSFDGSSNTLGQVYKLNGSVGYNFNRFFSVDTGLPIDFVNASDSSTAAGFSSKKGVGDAHVDLRLALSGPSSTSFSSTLRGTAPTGDKDLGFSTGRSTVDWTNYLDVSVGRWSPFGTIGLANSVADTHFFDRPFSTLGFVSNFEGGSNFQIRKGLSCGASGYALVPAGQQKVYSKLVKRQSSGTPTGGQGQGQGQGRGQGKTGVFETGSVTIGDADIAKDHGLSMWVDISPSPYVNFEFGYSRSVRYAFDTVFFNIGFNLGRLARKAYQH